jgi:tetratricopeptide (TPR) repeat protein
MRSLVWSLAVALAAASLAPPLPAQHKAAFTSDAERAALHNSPDWAIIAPHLPDPATASAAQLETMGDVLRARRFPEDALDYYGYAIERGGDVSTLLNKMGIVRLELHQLDLARTMFLRTVRAHRNNASAWNNLGVTDYANGNYIEAIREYQRASKLDKHSAVFHSNLGLAYFELNDTNSARHEFAKALHLDPDVMSERDAGGATAHMLSAHNYSGLCLQMAELYAQAKDVPQMLVWLGKAGDAGLDLRDAVHHTPAFAIFVKDPRMILLLQNEAELHGHSLAAAKPPSLGAASHP